MAQQQEQVGDTQIETAEKTGVLLNFDKPLKRNVKTSSSERSTLLPDHNRTLLTLFIPKTLRTLSTPLSSESRSTHGYGYGCVYSV